MTDHKEQSTTEESRSIFTDPFGLEYGEEELFQMEFYDEERQPHIEHNTWWPNQ